MRKPRTRNPILHVADTSRSSCTSPAIAQTLRFPLGSDFRLGMVRAGSSACSVIFYTILEVVERCYGHFSARQEDRGVTWNERLKVTHRGPTDLLPNKYCWRRRLFFSRLISIPLQHLVQEQHAADFCKVMREKRRDKKRKGIKQMWCKRLSYEACRRGRWSHGANAIRG